MKIIEISFSNINNLRGGPHIISFNKDPLESTGIFAIIGPTGSGKSTILDVITLALFNRIPRFKNKISKGEMSDLGSVLTHHTTSADASIIYEINGKQYHSKWSISKTRTGNLKDYEMSLSDSNGNYFDLKRSEVPAENEKIIGLKYEQFVKSIILSQGKFSEFLKADKNTRGQLLENITGTSIYRKIGRLAYEKFKAIKTEVEQENRSLDEIQVLTDEVKTELRNEITNAEKQKNELDIRFKKLNFLKEIKTQIFQIKENLTDGIVREDEINKELLSFQSDLLKLEIHDKIAPFIKDITRYNDANTNSKHSTEKIGQYEKELKIIETDLNININAISELTGVKVNESNFKKVLSAFELEIISLDNNIKAISKKGVEIRDRINLKLDDLAIRLDPKEKPSDALKKLNENQKGLALKLKEAGITDSSDLSKERKTLFKDQEYLKRLENYERTTIDIKENRNKKKEIDQKILSYQNDIRSNKPLKEKCDIAVTALEEKTILLQKRREDALKIANLTALRPELISGQACPLCGALEHPFTIHQPEADSPGIENEIELNNKILKKERIELQKINSKLVKANTSIVNAEEELKFIDKEWNKLKKLIEKYLLDIGIKASIKEKELSKLISNHKIAIIKKQGGLDAIHYYNNNLELISSYTTLEQSLNEYILFEKQRDKKFSGKDPSLECNKLEDEYTGLNNQKIKIEKSIEIENNEVTRSKADSDKLKLKLKPKVLKLGFNNIEALNQNILQEKELSEIKSKNENLKRKKTTIETELKNYNKELQILIVKDDQKEVDLSDIIIEIKKIKKERDTIIEGLGENNNKIKNDNDQKLRQKDKLDIIEKLNSKLEIWSILNNLIGDAKGSKFANFAQGLTLQNLLVYANKRLNNLSDRYLLDKPKGEGALQIIDQYQGNISRSVNTLSGGETFLISLALALSLSDMASKNVAIESIFIDEGFGTLDQETLEIALDTLEKLQSESQKMVGVISHVEALKERISVQIKLEKNAQGYSSIIIGTNQF